MPPLSRRAVGRLLVPAALLVLAACGSDNPSGVDSVLSAEEADAAVGTRTASNTRASACNGTLGAVAVADVRVPAGASCTLAGTRVNGNVIVSRDGSLLASGARIDGNVQAEDARRVMTESGTVVVGDIQVKRRAEARLMNTIVDGNVQVEEAGASLIMDDTRVRGDVQVKEAESAVIRGGSVRGNLQLEKNRAALRVSSIGVSGDFQVFENLGGVSLIGNRVAQALQCKENRPAPVGGGNEAGEKEEQCRAL